MLAPTETLEQLIDRLDAAIGLLPLDLDEGMVSLILDLPQAPDFPPQLDGPFFRFVHRDRHSFQAGYGVAAQWQAHGTDRLSRLRARAETLRTAWHQIDPDATGLRGLAMLGFAAAPEDVPRSAHRPLPNALLWVPAIAITGLRGRAAVVLSTALPAARGEIQARWGHWLERLIPLLVQRPPAAPLRSTRLHRALDRPDLLEWEALVEKALEQIAAGRLEKVVLSRRLSVEAPHAIDLQRLIGALGELFPSCQLIHLRQAGTSFVAATPERLLAQDRDRVEVDAIAGTVARAASLDRDLALGEALCNSAKDRREHELVIQAVRTALASCSVHVEVPPSPTVMQLRNAQHLWSPVQAKLQPGMDVFRLAELLHPTPATNGEPRRAASDWLGRSEGVDRGWYTGAAGILAPDLTGELWVLLRCAEISGMHADLFAGAGIVAGSDPLCEWQETEDKLAAMLSALQFA